MRLIPLISLTILVLATGCAAPGNGSGLSDFPIDSLEQRDLFTDPDSSLESIANYSALERENWQKPQVVISRLGDLSDKVVADIGAGTGYFTMRLARQARKVIAIDIDEAYLKYIERRLARTRDRKYLNIETRLTPEDNPLLSPGEADLVLIVNTYPYIGNRIAYFQKVRTGMSPTGELFVVDFKKQPLPVGPSVKEKISVDSVVSELGRAGFSVVEVDSLSLDYQFTIRAVKR